MYRVLCFLVIVSFLGIGSCKKKATDPDFCGSTWVTQVTDEANALSTAATAYATDPTTPNCNAYKAAFQDYLDALKPFADCAGWTEQDKNALLDAMDDTLP